MSEEQIIFIVLLLVVYLGFSYLVQYGICIMLSSFSDLLMCLLCP